MANFFYPAIDGNNEFEGLGIFKSTLPEEMDNNSYYQAYDTNIPDIKNVINAISKLSKLSLDAKKGIYQRKNDHLKYHGPSMHLALFLAMVNRSKEYKLNIIDNVWATGTITMSGNDPLLSPVVLREFDGKLREFGKDNNARLFIVPKGNIRPEEHNKLFNEYKIKNISLKKFKKLSKENLFKYNKKIVLSINEDELANLIDSIFIINLRDKITLNKIALICSILIMIIFLCFGAYYLNTIFKQKLLKKQVSSFYKTVYDSFINSSPPCIFDNNILPYTFNKNPNIEFIGACILTNDNTIAGDIAFHYKNSDEYIVLNCNNGYTQRFSKVNLNNFFIYNYDIYDLNVRILAEKYKNKDYLSKNEHIKVKQLNDKVLLSHNKSETTIILHSNNKISLKKINNINNNVINMPFVWIPGGCYKQIENSKIICSNGFWMSKHEVTQRQWQTIMKNNPAFFKNVGLDCPVESISWKQANQFIKKFNNIQKQTYSLPTEIEWDLAYNSSFSKPVSFQINKNQPRPICHYGEDKAGLCDINGNVMEWCQNSLQNYETTKPVRGYSWSLSGIDVNIKNNYDQDSHLSDLGFRLIWRK